MPLAHSGPTPKGVAMSDFSLTAEVKGLECDSVVPEGPAVLDKDSKALMVAANNKQFYNGSRINSKGHQLVSKDGPDVTYAEGDNIFKENFLASEEYYIQQIFGGHSLKRANTTYIPGPTVAQILAKTKKKKSDQTMRPSDEWLTVVQRASGAEKESSSS